VLLTTAVAGLWHHSCSLGCVVDFLDDRLQYLLRNRLLCISCTRWLPLCPWCDSFVSGGALLWPLCNRDEENHRRQKRGQECGVLDGLPGTHNSVLALQAKRNFSSLS